MSLEQDHDLLVRIDERTTSLHAAISEMKMAYVTRSEFKPVRIIAYGMVGLVLVGVMTALLNKVLIK